MDALGPVIAGAIENHLREKGISISDSELFAQILFEEFLATFTEEMQKVTVQKYLATFSEFELKEIADFYRSSSGQAYLRESPGLLKFGAMQGERLGATAGRQLGPRVADRLESCLLYTSPSPRD